MTKPLGTNEKLLRGCYKKALQLLIESNLKSIAFSCLSTGVYGYPPYEAAQVALSTVREFLDSEDGKRVDLVVFCLFEMKDVRAYNELIPYVCPVF